jgi:small multidrug resistance pump
MTTSRWMTITLYAAAIYNLAWGAFTILFPNAIFDWLGADRPNYPGIWQCVGMIVGVYGIGYALAARDPARHWPIVLVGLLGKIFGPIGFIDQALIQKTFPLAFGWTIITNDLMWWVPFALILIHARRVHVNNSTPQQNR